MARSKNTDQNERSGLIKALEGFGLSEKEARVYFALLPYRDIGSSKLVFATGLHKQFVYNALARLEELGLAKHVIQNGRKKFSAVTPKRLLSIAEEKKLAAQSMAQKLQPYFAGLHEQDFEVIQGYSAFIGYQLSLMERMPEGTSIDVITGANDKYFSTLGDEGAADEFEKMRIKRNISVRYLSDPVRRDELKAMEEWRELWTYKVFPGLSTGLVDISVWPDTLLLNVFGNPLISFVITSKEVERGYREFFNALWNVAAK